MVNTPTYSTKLHSLLSINIIILFSPVYKNKKQPTELGSLANLGLYQ
jgi:hypothetical protein